MGYLKDKSTNDIGMSHKFKIYKYGRRNFGVEIYNIAKWKANKGLCKKLITNDIMNDQLSLTEYIDTFAGEASKKINKKVATAIVWRTNVVSELFQRVFQRVLIPS